MTKGSLGWVKNLRFTTVLSIRQARSDERVVKSTGAIPAPQTEKEYILTLFHTILISNLFSAVFSPVFQTAITSARLSAVFSPVFHTAITSAELSAVFSPVFHTDITSVELRRCLMTIFKDSHHFSRTFGDV